MVTNWEKNHSQPRLYLLSKIIEFLGYAPFELPEETFEYNQTTIRDCDDGKHRTSKKILNSIYNNFGGDFLQF